MSKMAASQSEVKANAGASADVAPVEDVAKPTTKRRSANIDIDVE